jgi:hypothetical protein
MSNLFILIYLGERGDEVNETWKGGGGAQAIKVWEPLI